MQDDLRGCVVLGEILLARPESVEACDFRSQWLKRKEDT